MKNKDENELFVSYTRGKQEPSAVVQREMFNALSKLSGLGYKFRTYEPSRVDVCAAWAPIYILAGIY
jgi:hypothetical protein